MDFFQKMKIQSQSEILLRFPGHFCAGLLCCWSVGGNDEENGSGEEATAEPTEETVPAAIVGEFEDSVYTFRRYPNGTFSDFALAFCYSWLNGNLASIHSQEENDFFQGLLQEVDFNRTAWIGLQQQQDSSAKSSNACVKCWPWNQKAKKKKKKPRESWSGGTSSAAQPSNCTACCGNRLWCEPSLFVP